MSKFAPFLLCFLLVACGNNPSPNPPTMPTLENAPLPSSAWGEVLLLSQAEDLSAPSFLALNEGLFFAWTGSQEGEARLFSQGINGSSQIMALKAYYPNHLRLYEGDNRVLMLWLDRNFDTVNMRLQTALISANGIAELGILSLSDIPTRAYTSLQSESTLTIVYSAGIGALNNLYLQRMDTSARPFLQADLRNDADYPALIVDTNGTLLFWLEDNGQVAYLGRLGERDLTEIRLLGQIHLSPEETVEEFRVGFDGSYAYLFWQIRALDASRHVILSVGTPDGEFTEPIALDAAWAIPAESTTSLGLPVALNIGNQLGIAYFNSGTMGDFQPIVESGTLLGAPNIALVSNGRLGLSWSSPSPNGYANLLYTEED